jgi:hypothetical protein
MCSLLTPKMDSLNASWHSSFTEAYSVDGGTIVLNSIKNTGYLYET